MAQIAVIGTGVIGGGMAVNLLRNGHQVAVWNRTAEHAAEVVGAGATLAATPADAARGADVVFEATADDVSSRSVWLGDEGIIAGSAESATLVTSATLSPGWVAELAEACRSAARPFLDMPVTGGRAGAENGALDHARRRRRGHAWRRSPMSSTPSRRPSGTSVPSAAVRSSSWCSTLSRRPTSSPSARRWRWPVRPDSISTRSAQALVDRLGGPVTTMAWAAHGQAPARANFALAWALKDLRYASAMAGDLPTPILDVAVERLSAAEADGLGDHDWTVVAAAST